MELIGIQRARGRDLATGIVLGAGLGLAALFLYLGTTYDSTTGATVTILFGSIFALRRLDPAARRRARRGRARLICWCSYRPLLLSSVSPELAAARGIPVRLVGGLYLLALALAVALAAVTIGAILSTALLVGRPPTALRLTRRPGAGDRHRRRCSASARCGSGSCSRTTATTGRRSTTAGRSASSS